MIDKRQDYESEYQEEQTDKSNTKGEDRERLMKLAR